MAADILILQHILVNQQAHGMFMIVHQAHDADRARFDIQVLQHFLRAGKGQAGGVDLAGKLLRLELLVAGHHQKIEVRPLPVAEEQVLADDDAQDCVDLVAGFHVVRTVVVRPLICDPQPVQEVVGADLPREPSFF